MYKVIKNFVDLQDNNYPYKAGDVFPRKGLEVKPERITELAGSENKQGTPLIELVDETKGFDQMKKDELQAYAKEKNIDLGDAKTKEEIIAKIEEAEAE